MSLPNGVLDNIFSGGDGRRHTDRVPSTGWCSPLPRFLPQRQYREQPHGGVVLGELAISAYAGQRRVPEQALDKGVYSYRACWVPKSRVTLI
jgi:hypothetical protein